MSSTSSAGRRVNSASIRRRPTAYGCCSAAPSWDTRTSTSSLPGVSARASTPRSSSPSSMDKRCRSPSELRMGQSWPILNSEGDRQRLSIDDGDELRGVDALALTPGSDDVDVRVSQLGAAEQHPYAVGLRRIEAELTRLPA